MAKKITEVKETYPILQHSCAEKVSKSAYMAKNIFLCYCLIKERTSRLANSFYSKETFSYISYSHLKSTRVNFDNEAQPCFHESYRKVNIHIGTS